MNDGRDAICVWILGLMHSGTTIVWRAWRKDGRFLCLDEPFSGLGVLPSDRTKSTYSEFIAILRNDPRRFWRYYAPLHPLEELDSSFTTEQVSYLRFLLARSRKVVMDETHLHLHLSALAELTPGAYVIHLVRRASGFTTSHLRPSWSRDTNWPRRVARRLRDEYNKRSFWTRQDVAPGLRRLDVIGADPLSKFGLILADAGYDAARIMNSPALVRLLAYWHYHYHYLEREGPTLFGERFTRVRYEDFATDPAGVMARLYDWIDLAPPGSDGHPEVHRPKLPYRPRDRRWREAARMAGFNAEEIVTLL